MVQVRRDFNTLSVRIAFNLNSNLPKNALESLHKTLILFPILLHAEQEAVEHTVILRSEAVLAEDFFVGAEKAARGAIGC